MVQNIKEEYPIGRHVQVISKTSRHHYKQFGRIVGYTKTDNYIRVYFRETKSCANFAPGSLYRIN